MKAPTAIGLGGGTLKIIAAMKHPPVITTILTHLPRAAPGPSMDSNWSDPLPIPAPIAPASGTKEKPPLAPHDPIVDTTSTPTLTGSWRGSDPARLSVSVEDGKTYKVEVDGALTVGDPDQTSWSLKIPVADLLRQGRHEITASYEYVNPITATGSITVTATE